jgi:hypothetical protein
MPYEVAHCLSDLFKTIMDEVDQGNPAARLLPTLDPVPPFCHLYLQNYLLVDLMQMKDPGMRA